MKVFHVHLYLSIILFRKSISVNAISNSSDRMRSPYKRIIGGHVAKINDFPSTACLILRKPEGEDFRGGAVIVHEYWAVTAAHCMSYISNTDITKRIAFVRSNSAHWLEHYIDHTVIHSFVHEWYNDNLTDYDISLLKVKEPFNGKYEKPAKLPTSNYKYTTNSIATVLGWGTTDPEATDPFVVSYLRYANIKILNHDICKHHYRQANEMVTPRMVCAGSSGKDACVYDSGGPLYQNNLLIGLVSWGGTYCADDQLPGIYTKVSEFSKWVDEIISREA